MPFKIRSFYKGIFFKNMAIYLNTFTRRDKKEYVLNVDWYRFDDTLKKYVTLGIQQDMVVNTDTFDSEWKPLEI